MNRSNVALLLPLGVLQAYSPSAFAEPEAAESSTPVQRRCSDRNEADAGSGDHDEECEEEAHHGFFGRLSAGLGYGWVGGADLEPEPGFKPVEDLSHGAPVLGLSLQGGGGLHDFSLAAELSYERMLLSLDEPSHVSFHLFGLGVSAAYYLPDDWHIGAQLRLLGLILWRDQIPCFWDRADATGGTGVGLTVGKEWYGKDDSGFGFALQGQYARFTGKPELRYMSLLAAVTLTRF